MSLRFPFFIFIMAVLFLNCSSRKLIDQKEIRELKHITQPDSLFSQRQDFKTLVINNALFRLDYKGEFRTLRATLLLSRDSIIFITIHTPFRSTLAALKATSNNIIFINKQDKKAYQFDYEYLSKKLGVDLTYRDLQSYLLGYPHLNEEQRTDSDMSFFLKEETENYSLYSFPYNISFGPAEDIYSKNYKFSISTNRLLEFYHLDNNEKTIFSTSLKWKDKFNLVLPKSISILMLYDQEPLEIEFDYKSFVYEEPIFIAIDSTMYIQHLIDE